MVTDLENFLPSQVRSPPACHVKANFISNCLDEETRDVIWFFNLSEPNRYSLT
jgi:hypothetical protein